MLRALAERLSRNRWLRRRLPNGVEFYISPDSQLKYLKGAFDKDLIALANTYAGADSIVWDVGANCGVLAFAANRAKAVYAIEADPFLAFLLQQSISLNHAPVHVVPAAASDTAGLAEFAIASRGRASNHLVSDGGRSQAGGERGRILVPTITLDDLMDRTGAPTLIKIDVEGGEVRVLEGARRVLSEARPLVYFEAVDATVSACEAILRAANYRVTKAAEMNWFAEPL